MRSEKVRRKTIRKRAPASQRVKRSRTKKTKKTKRTKRKIKKSRRAYIKKTHKKRQKGGSDAPEETKKEKEAKERHQRGHIAKEILSTEQSYVESLQTLISDYIEPLEVKARASELDISAAQCSRLFSGVEDLVTAHATLLDNMKQLIGGKDISDVAIGNIFLSKIMDVLEQLHMKWKGNQVTRLDTYNKCRENEEFVKFLLDRITEARSQRKTLHNLDAYLIMPIQRFPRYVLLLKELRKVTPSGHPDDASLDEAIEAQQERTMAVNDAPDAYAGDWGVPASWPCSTSRAVTEKDCDKSEGEFSPTPKTRLQRARKALKNAVDDHRLG
jgi:hypothetical protein